MGTKLRQLPQRLSALIEERFGLLGLWLAFAMFALPAMGAVTNPAVKAPPIRTNAPARPVTLTNAASAGTNKAAVVSTNQFSFSKVAKSLQAFPSSPYFYPAIGVVIILLVAVLVYRASKQKAAEKQLGGGVARLKVGAKKVFHSCNVLELTPEANRVWHFDARGSSFVLRTQETAFVGHPLPAGLVAKDWRDFVQPRLNIAWLGHENVFLRVVQLPMSSFEETLSMVELQLEKLSPIPVAQIAWSFQRVQHAQGNMQTVIVMIVARSVVEELLGKLEGQGFLADRLELPLLDQLQATPITDDGAYIYPEVGGKASALVAWWYGGVLQNLDLLSLPTENQAEGLKEQIFQMAWAGEMEGWLTAPPKYHLVADKDIGATWEVVLREGLGDAIEREQPLGAGELAGLTAKRGASADPRANLLPIEFAERYRNLAIDRLWMRGVGAVIGVYLVGVVIYFVALYVLSQSTGGIENEVASQGLNYTNAIRLRDQFVVLKDREELKYAALDTWNAAATHLPEGITMDSMQFSEGKRVVMAGTAPTDQTQAVLDFESKMRKATVNGRPLFNDKGETMSYRTVQTPAGPMAVWSFTLELMRTEGQ